MALSMVGLLQIGAVLIILQRKTRTADNNI